jgi:pimeloyl-ACP methyl ester carboxylesterase
MASPLPATDVLVHIPAGRTILEGTVHIPANAGGLVLFAHGSGSSRLSPRNVFVARELQRVGVGTMLFDLLTQAEAEDRTYVFDIDFLADRLGTAVEWASKAAETSSYAIGLFGASTGAAAALQVAARLPDEIKAVVSRGGRPDLALHDLPSVRAPTLLIVGGHDYEVIELNREAFARLRCPKELVVIPGATHLFSEPGTLEQAAQRAADWFVTHLLH